MVIQQMRPFMQWEERRCFLVTGYQIAYESFQEISVPSMLAHSVIVCEIERIPEVKAAGKSWVMFC